MRAVVLRLFLLPVLATVTSTPLCRAGMDTGEASGNSSATTELITRNWSTDDGLPHNVVTRIEQDHVGFLWLATLAGLTRFDGHEFKLFGATAHSEKGGRNIRDFAVCADSSILFLPSSGGLLLLKNDLVTPHPLSAQLEGQTLTELFLEPKGAIWVGTENGLVRWENNRTERFGAAEGINRRFLRFSFATDGENRVWIGGAAFLGYYENGKLIKVRDEANLIYHVASARSGGLWVFGESLQKWEKGQLVSIAPAPWPSGHSSVRALFEDREGVLWMGTSRDGAYRLRGGRLAPVAGIDTPLEFISEDREGSIWVASYGSGIYRVNTNAFTIFDAHSGFTEDIATAISEDRHGNLWFAKHGIGVVRKTGDTVQTFPFTVNRAPIFVNSLCVDPEGELWMSAPTGVFHASPPDYSAGHRMNPVQRNSRLLFCTQAGDVWVGGGNLLGFFHAGVFTTISEGGAANGKTPEVSAITEFPAGHLWLGTTRGELFEWDGTLLHRSPAQLDANGHGGSISGFLAEPSGALWIATTDGLYLKKNDNFQRFSQADGLPDDLLLQFLADDHGSFWFGTPRGISRVPRDELESLAAGRISRVNTVTYGPDEGLSGISPAANYQPSALKDHRGSLWFCTYKGVVEINPALVQRLTPPPPVLIETIRVDGNVQASQDDVRISSGEHRLDFSFGALSFLAPARVLLRHRLEGFDSDWVETPPDRIARYAKLPPGNYRLHVIACNAEGVWNREGAVLGVTVLPMWWQTSAFRGIAFVAFTGAITLAARYWSQRKLRRQVDELERERALEKERTRIARDMHDDLGGSVTGINLLVQQLRGQPAERDVSNIAERLDARVQRLTVELERVVWTVSPKNSSLDQLATFIERFAHNLFESSKIDCRVRGREEIPARPLTPEGQHHILAVTKEAINNVLKHSHATEAIVAMSFAENVFTLSIRDNGQGFVPEAQEHSERNGLRNMRARISEIGGVLEIRSRSLNVETKELSSADGTEVVLRVPIESSHPKRIL